jgi:hypothetical protein
MKKGNSQRAVPSSATMARPEAREALFCCFSQCHFNKGATVALTAESNLAFC